MPSNREFLKIKGWSSHGSTGSRYRFYYFLFLFLGELLSPFIHEKKKIEYLKKLERWFDVNVCYKRLIEARFVLCHTLLDILLFCFNIILNHCVASTTIKWRSITIQSQWHGICLRRRCSRRSLLSWWLEQPRGKESCLKTFSHAFHCFKSDKKTLVFQFWVELAN